VATRRKATQVTSTDFTAAVERIVAGLEKRNRLLNPQERRAVAHHEMGHALVALALPGSDAIHKVSIIPRGMGSLGYTLQRPTEDRYLMTLDELQRKVCVLLAGRAAEKLVLGSLSTGAADDLVKATQIARDMVMRYGMDEGLGCVSYDSPHPAWIGVPEELHAPMPVVAEATQKTIDEAVHRIVMQGFDEAWSILLKNRALLEHCASELLAQETLDAHALRNMTAGIQALESKQEVLD
jgi:cell division protease FtsH